MTKKNEFKPDKPRSGIASKLFLTKKQRASILKWGLYGLVLVVLSVLQDVLLSRVRLFGATTELVICGIFAVCVTEDLEQGSVFSLVAACAYYFSGSAAGLYSIVLIPALSIGISYFRVSYLRRGFPAAMLCICVAVGVYCMAVFVIGVFLNLTTPARVLIHALSALMTVVSAPVLYPIVTGISTIGGKAWKE